MRFLGSVSRLISSIGWIGRERRRRCGRRLAVSGSTPLTDSTRRRPQYFSPSLGARDDAADAVAGAEAEAAHLAGRDVDIIRAGHEAAAAHEAEAVVDDVEDAGGVGLSAALDLALEDPLDQVVLAHLACVGDVKSPTDLDQLVEVLALEFVDIHCLGLFPLGRVERIQGGRASDEMGRVLRAPLRHTRCARTEPLEGMIPESRGQQPSFGGSGDAKNHITACGTVNSRPL